MYALGCILYDMLCGGPPFDSQGVGAVIAAHLYEDPIPPRRRVPAIPAALDALVLRLLAKSPDERPQSMIEVDALLANVLAPLERPELEVEMELECEIEIDGAPGMTPRATAAPMPAVSAIGSGPILIAPRARRSCSATGRPAAAAR